MKRLQDVTRPIVAWWKGQQLVVRGGLLGAVGVLLGAVVATTVLAGGSSAPTAVVVRQTPPSVASVAATSEDATSTPTVEPTPSASSTGTATAEPTETPEPAETPEAAIGTIEELVSLYGHPAGYNFARLRIPSLGVDAPVGASLVGGAAGAQMGTPEGPATTFWYDLSEWAGLGGRPGEGGNAIFSGHVDLASYVPYADVNYRGPGVFAELKTLIPGDRIFVDYEGEVLEYQVVWKEQVNAGNGSRWAEIWSNDVSVDSITVYTCGGDFDNTGRGYIDRVVVRAERV